MKDLCALFEWANNVSFEKWVRGRLSKMPQIELRLTRPRMYRLIMSEDITTAVQSIVSRMGCVMFNDVALELPQVPREQITKALERLKLYNPTGTTIYATSLENLNQRFIEEEKLALGLHFVEEHGTVFMTIAEQQVNNVLYTRRSSIVGAGNGVFAKVDLPWGFRFRLPGNIEAVTNSDEKIDRVYAFADGQRQLNCTGLKGYLPTEMNDAGPSKENFVAYESDNGKAIYLEATKLIVADDELYTCYGAGPGQFWDFTPLYDEYPDRPMDFNSLEQRAREERSSGRSQPEMVTATPENQQLPGSPSSPDPQQLLLEEVAPSSDASKCSQPEMVAVTPESQRLPSTPSPEPQQLSNNSPEPAPSSDASEVSQHNYAEMNTATSWMRTSTWLPSTPSSSESQEPVEDSPEELAPSSDASERSQSEMDIVVLESRQLPSTPSSPEPQELMKDSPEELAPSSNASKRSQPELVPRSPKRLQLRLEEEPFDLSDFIEERYKRTSFHDMLSVQRRTNGFEDIFYTEVSLQEFASRSHSDCSWKEILLALAIGSLYFARSETSKIAPFVGGWLQSQQLEQQLEDLRPMLVEQRPNSVSAQPVIEGFEAMITEARTSESTRLSLYEWVSEHTAFVVSVLKHEARCDNELVTDLARFTIDTSEKAEALCDDNAIRPRILALWNKLEGETRDSGCSQAVNPFM